MAYGLRANGLGVGLLCVTLCGAILALCSCGNHKQVASPTGLEHAVRKYLDVSHFDPSRLDEITIVVVESDRGRKVFSRGDLEKFVQHTRAAHEDYTAADFRVLKIDESASSRFGFISYEVTWNVKLPNSNGSAHVLSKELWERATDGWHRMFAAIEAQENAAKNPVNGIVDKLAASVDEKGNHPGIVSIEHTGRVTCTDTGTSSGALQIPVSCRINGPGFSGTLKRNGSAALMGNGTVTLMCEGPDGKLSCSAEVVQNASVRNRVHQKSNECRQLGSV